MRLSPDRRRGWRVRIPAHVVADRFRVPAYDDVIGCETRLAALQIACRNAHRDARVAPWRPWLRETARLAGAEWVVIE